MSCDDSVVIWYVRSWRHFFAIVTSVHHGNIGTLRDDVDADLDAIYRCLSWSQLLADGLIPRPCGVRNIQLQMRREIKSARVSHGSTGPLERFEMLKVPRSARKAVGQS